MGHPDKPQPQGHLDPGTCLDQHLSAVAQLALYSSAIQAHLHRLYGHQASCRTALVQVRQTPFPPFAQEELHCLWQELIEWRSNTPKPGPSLLASPRSTLNPGRRKNDFVVDGIQTWISMLYSGCLAMWNSLIGIEFGTFCEEFLISVNFSNPRSICYCDYRGCPIHIISGPPGRPRPPQLGPSIPIAQYEAGRDPSSSGPYGHVELLVVSGLLPLDIPRTIIVSVRSLAKTSALAISRSRQCGRGIG